MAQPNFAIFVDLENVGAKADMLNYVIEKVKIRGDILLGKVYGYTDRYTELKEILLSNTFSVVPSIKFGGSQKNNLDIQLVIDAMEVMYTNPLIDSFCIVSGDSDYTPLVGKLKTMGKFVLGISRSEVASKVFINACSEFVFLESVSSKGAKRDPDSDDHSNNGNSVSQLAKIVEDILDEQCDGDGYLHASELKNTILRLKPDFNEKNYGVASFGKLMAMLESRYHAIQITQDNFAVKVSLRKGQDPVAGIITKDNWKSIFVQQLKLYKESGFDRINPSILKAAVQAKHPDFDERQFGFKRFSDLMKELAKDGYVQVEVDDAGTMLVQIP